MSDEIKPTILCNIYEATLQGMAEILLAPRGYGIIRASNAGQAIPETSKAHLVISDVSNGGYRLYDHVKKNYPSMPIILIDGGLLEKDRTPDAIVIEKPFSPKYLVALVEQHFPQHLKPSQQQ